MVATKKVACGRSVTLGLATSHRTPFRRENAEFAPVGTTLSGSIVILFAFRLAQFFEFVPQQHVLAYETSQSAVAVDEPPPIIKRRQHQYHNYQDKGRGHCRSDDV